MNITLTDAERRVLSVMARPETEQWTTGSLGTAVWGRKLGSNCSAPHARTAGRVLQRLEKRRLVFQGLYGSEPLAWMITSAGRTALAQK